MSRILTTHVGSLPRSQEVVDFIFSRENNHQYDKAEFDVCMKKNVSDTAEKQKKAGIDIVSDGETSKISYATYVKDRYSGFSGDSPRNPPEDLKMFPGYLQRLADDGGTPQYARPMCTSEVFSKGQGELGKDIANLKSAMKTHGIKRGFMNAASPGVISLFLQNDFYPTRDAYLAALADVMRDEYETIVASGLDLQLDCPDLALSRHMLFSDLSDLEFIKIAESHMEALNHALKNVPEEKVRIHICWGNYEGPHCCDIDMNKVFGTLMKAKARYTLFETSNPRHAHEWTVFRNRKNEIPDNKITNGKKLFSKLGTNSNDRIMGVEIATLKSLKKLISSNIFIIKPKQKKIKNILITTLLNSLARYLFNIKVLTIIFKINFHNFD